MARNAAPATAEKMESFILRIGSEVSQQALIEVMYGLAGLESRNGKLG
jgi:hypothetical protein